MTFLTLLPAMTLAEDFIKIEISQDYKSYSKKELKKRVWKLEKAVWQLQQKVEYLEKLIALQENKPQKPVKPINKWICIIKASGDQFTEIGATKAEAKVKVLKSCKKALDGGFFCSKPKCEFNDQ